MSNEHDKSTALTTTQQKLARIEHLLPAIDEAGRNLRELVKADNGSPSHAIRQAAAMQTLRELLTPEVMEPIMALQNNPLGFKTDLKGNGYDPATVRDVTITALGRGSQMTLNRTNIISAQCYLTKEYFAEALDAAQGRGRWMFVHGIPRVQTGKKMYKDKRTGEYSEVTGVVGAILETEVRWIGEDGQWQSQVLTHAIKGDEYATSDSYCGKADRKCGAWLLARVTGEHVPEGEADEDGTINVTPTSVTDAPAEPTRAAKAAADIRSRKAATRKEAEDLPTTPDDIDALVAHAVAAVGVPREVLEQYLHAIPANSRYWIAGSLKNLSAAKLRELAEKADSVRSEVSAWADSKEAK